MYNVTGGAIADSIAPYSIAPVDAAPVDALAAVGAETAEAVAAVEAVPSTGWQFGNELRMHGHAFDAYLTAKEERREAIKHIEIAALSNMTGFGYATFNLKGEEWTIEDSTIDFDSSGKYVTRGVRLNQSSGVYQYLQENKSWEGLLRVGDEPRLAFIWSRGNGKAAMLNQNYGSANYSANYRGFGISDEAIAGGTATATDYKNPLWIGGINGSGVDVNFQFGHQNTHVLDTSLPKWRK